jgi:hypothetical protein
MALALLHLALALSQVLGLGLDVAGLVNITG